MSRVLEYRPKEIPQINNPATNLLNALTDYIDLVVERRLNERLEIEQTKTEPNPRQILKAKELGKILRYSESTINDMADRGEIPTVSSREVGTKTFRRFDLNEVLAALQPKN